MSSLATLKRLPAEGLQRTVFLFSGQGSQCYQMGKSLYESNLVFRDWMLRMDGAVRDLCGISVLQSLYAPDNGKGTAFEELSLTHPAIFMIEYSLAQALICAGVRPDITVGASLGSFAAACVAGFLDVHAALEAVVQHAAAIKTHCQPGGMVAIFASPSLYDEAFLRTQSDMAAINYDSHFVVATTLARCTVIETELQRRKLAYRRLPVPFAFHSRWIEEARNALRGTVRTLTRSPARLPLICCASTQAVSYMDDAYFWDVARKPIRFQETIAALERTGPYRYVDVGPSSTLATFLKYGLPATSQSGVHGVLSVFGRDAANFSALAAAGR